ncbi:hypothetical protein GGR56DRAFT_262822 [Xylariaceae sp. FL0804]|nr:hypothetical protein GGR56DRAFT_262822 [Xylariaceae sp. FL0804]
MVSAAMAPRIQPLALARQHVATAPWCCEKGPQDTYTKHLDTFLTRHWNRDTEKQFDMNSLTLNCAANLMSFHEMVVDMAKGLATEALAKIGTPGIKDTSPIPKHTVSSTELGRFVKALYIFELVSKLFTVSRGEAEDHLGRLWLTFWMAFAPWEAKQVRCVMYMLKERIRKATKVKHLYTPRQIHPDCVRVLFDRGLSGMEDSMQAIAKTTDGNTLYRYLSSLEQFPEQYPSRGFNSWYLRTDPLWLTLVDRVDGPRAVSLNIDEILESYPDQANSGPVVAWYHDLIQDYVKDKDNDFLAYGRDNLFVCSFCMAQWGFVFWDHETLISISGGHMPELTRMRELAAQTQIAYIDWLRDTLDFAADRNIRFHTH